MMHTAAALATVVVALLHLWFLVLEMFLWTTPTGRRVFRTTESFAKESAALAMNQGLYNGFVAAGLVWGLAQGPGGFMTRVFFLGFVVVAGIFGAATASRGILWVQALPGAVALALALLARG